MEQTPLVADGFTIILHRLIIHEGKKPVRELADALGLTPRTFYARLANRSRFDPREMTVLLREIPDEALVRWLFARSSLVPVRRPPSRAWNSDDFQQHLVRSAESAAAALLDLVDGMSQTSVARWNRIGVQIRAAQAELLSIGLKIGHRVPDPLPHDCGDFASLVRQRLVSARGLSLGSIAAALGLSYHNLHARISGRVAFDPMDLRKLFEKYPDAEIAGALLAGTPYVAFSIPRAQGGAGDPGPMHAGMFALKEVMAILDRLCSAQPYERSWMDGLGASIDAAVQYMEMLHWSSAYLGRARVSDSAVRSSSGGQPLSGSATKSRVPPQALHG